MRLTADDDPGGQDQHGQAEHGDGTEITALLQVEDQHRQHLGLGGEKDHGRRQLADHGDKNETPGGNETWPEQRRRHVFQRAQPRGPENASGLLQLGR
jgi:hypothetical protein